MKNYVKEYLDSGKSLTDLKEEFGIDKRVYDDGLVIFSYSQIDSPKTNPLVRMCRGLILEKDTWNIVNYPFYRFYNFDEVFEERTKFNWDKAVATEKVDGSLLSVFNYKSKWYIATRSWVGGDNAVNALGMTFNDIFDKAVLPYTRQEFFETLDPNCTYIFELVSPWNMIVTPYEKAALYCIGGRNKIDFQEDSFESIYNKTWSSNKFKDIIKIPKVISLSNSDGSFKGFEEMRNLANSVGEKDEGFVVTDFSSLLDGSFPRVKVKNSSYLVLHHLKGTLENNAINFGEILTIIYKNEQDEVLASLPQYKDIFADVEAKWKVFKSEFEAALNDPCFTKFWEMDEISRKDPANKKDFALAVNNGIYKKFSQYLFVCFNKGYNTLKECFENDKKPIHDVLKTIWDKYMK